MAGHRAAILFTFSLTERQIFISLIIKSLVLIVTVTAGDFLQSVPKKIDTDLERCYNSVNKKVTQGAIMITNLEEALIYISELEAENKALREELEQYKNITPAGRRKHDETWMASYNDFAMKYESGMSIMEIVNQGEISRRTAYRYKAYYDEIKKT